MAAIPVGRQTEYRNMLKGRGHRDAVIDALDLSTELQLRSEMIRLHSLTETQYTGSNVG